MAEIGLIASVVGVAGAALKSSQALFIMIDQVRNAPVELSAIANDTHSFHDVVTSIQMAIRDPVIVRVLQSDRKLCDLVVRLEEPLQNCSAVLVQLKPRIQPHLKSSSDGKLRFSNVSVRWVFKRKDILDCSSRLEATKSTLDAALTSIVFFCSLRSAGRDFGNLSRRESIMSDPGFDVGSVLREYADSIAPQSPLVNATSESELELPELLACGARDVPEPLDGMGSIPVSGSSTHHTGPISWRENYFRLAIETGDTRTISEMIDEGCDVNTRAKDGQTALHVVALTGEGYLLRKLISRKADVNARRSITQSTPLHYAAHNGHLNTVQALVQYGADTTLEHSSLEARLEYRRETALHAALRGLHEDVAIHLIQYGSPLLTIDVYSQTPLHIACTDGSPKLVEALIKGGKYKGQLTAMLEATTNNLSRPLHNAILAATHDSAAVMHSLLDAGANINVGDIGGSTPLMLAAFYGRIDPMMLLITRLADRGARNDDGQDYIDILRSEHPLLYYEINGKLNALLEPGER